MDTKNQGLIAFLLAVDEDDFTVSNTGSIGNRTSNFMRNFDDVYTIKPPWISVLDMLPPEDDLVLVIVEYMDGDREGSLEYVFGYWEENPRSKFKNYTSWNLEGWCLDCDDLCLPIAWMEIPECIVDEEEEEEEKTKNSSFRIPNLFGRC